MNKVNPKMTEVKNKGKVGFKEKLKHLVSTEIQETHQPQRLKHGVKMTSYSILNQIHY